MNNSTWQRLAGLAATLAGGNGLWRRSQEGSRDSTIADAAHPDPSVSLSAPARLETLLLDETRSHRLHSSGPIFWNF